MTTDQKIAKIRFYIDCVKPHTDLTIRTYFAGLAQGANNAWFIDGSITAETYEELNKELDNVGDGK